MWPFSRIRQLEDETALELARRLVGHPAQGATGWRTDMDQCPKDRPYLVQERDGDGRISYHVAERKGAGRGILIVGGSFGFDRGGKIIAWRDFLTEPPAEIQPDKCSRCGYERKEHAYNGACYGICGEFVSQSPAANDSVAQFATDRAPEPDEGREDAGSTPAAVAHSQPATPPAASADISLAERSYLRGKGMSDEEIDASHSRSQPGKTMHPWVCCYCDAPLACEKCGREQPSELS